jgi:hypothetical protein
VFLFCLNKGFDFFYTQAENEAKNMDYFPVTLQTYSNSEGTVIYSEVAVIRNYGDYLYAVPIIRKTNEQEKTQFEKKLVILKMSQADNKPLTLTMKKIGPLQPIEAKP